MKQRKAAHALARKTAVTPRPRTRRWGAELEADAVEFRVWAPSHAQMGLRLDSERQARPMQALDAGWHGLHVPGIGAGTRYRLVLPDGREMADPASLCQPDGVDGASEVFDTSACTWRHAEWQPRPWHEAVIYELHVGTFTAEGTFRAAIERLDHLVSLGVTAIEIMPVAAFPGTRNWGYDGVLPYAPAAAYGRPEDLMALLDAAHGAGLMVILDVVYNHFGPEGSVMHSIAPDFFTEHHHTPWGAGFAFDEHAAVREFFIDNALYWLEVFRFDGLRLDAVHAIQDDSDVHIIDEIATTLAQRCPGRHLILENEDNEAHRLERRDGRPVLATAQWNDDVHHTLHVAATGENSGYYADYEDDRAMLVRALAEGFAFQGEHMAYRGSARGEPSAHLPPTAFIAFLQNHDQVGNRAFGDRLNTQVAPEVMRALAAVYLLLPQVPMLFMGEEWGTTRPFPFFCDFHGDLKKAVVEGRRNEFSRFEQFADPAQRERIPDPTADETFASAKLDWENLMQPEGREWFAWYQRVLEVRRGEIMPHLPGIRRGGEYALCHGVVEVRWSLADGGWLLLVANLTASNADLPLLPERRVIWQEGQIGMRLGPWSVEWSVGESR